MKKERLVGWIGLMKTKEGKMSRMDWMDED